MEGIANFISMLDYVLDTKRKRHITGGLLLSGALLFGGLAMTVMSIRDDEEDEDKLWVTIERRKQHGKQQGGSERERA